MGRRTMPWNEGKQRWESLKYENCETLAEVVGKYKAEDPEGRELNLWNRGDLTGKPPPGDGLRSSHLPAWVVR